MCVCDIRGNDIRLSTQPRGILRPIAVGWGRPRHGVYEPVSCRMCRGG
ncbi:unnamed protein product, partial [Rhizoctonia solani]